MGKTGIQLEAMFGPRGSIHDERIPIGREIEREWSSQSTGSSFYKRTVHLI